MSASSSISSSSFNDYNTQLQGSALKATRAAVSLPADIPFHRSIHPEFAKGLDQCSARVLSLTNKLLSLSTTVNASTTSRGKGKARLEAQDDVVDNFHSLVVDVMDQLLENADIGLDEFLGHSKAPAIAVNPAPATAQKKKPAATQTRLDPVLQHAAHLAKPQLSFKRKVDNSNHTAWTPTLKHKYNAQVPLGYNFGEEGEEPLTSLHPYRYEIKHISYPLRMFTSTPPILPRSFEETPFSWVSTPQEFASMLDKLRSAAEIAIDLEHHSYRTFSGFVCLMQISTREEDFVVDTLALREELEELNEVFTDPNIVLHGAESDIIWLQQDFNLYIVNIFDTYHASKVLDFPRHGLAALLEMYCDFTADKRYQLADWRIRPLPAEMLQYARSDTHFLLFIYDNLRDALLDCAQSRAQSRAQSPSSPTSSPPPDPSIPVAHLLVREVLMRSEETALRVYEKEIYDAESGLGPGGWDTLARKWNKTLLMGTSAGTDASSAVNVQRAVYRAVHTWRDKIAREEDESTRYVLPNHYIFSLAERTPADMAALLSVFRPAPPIIRRRAKELLDAIRNAVKGALGAAGPASSSAEPVTSTKEAEVAMSVDEKVEGVVTTSVSSVASASLWSNVSAITASSSKLFGPSLLRNAPSVLPIASQSSLLGGTSSATSKLPRTTSNKARFLETATRIHSALVIAPTVPKIVSIEKEAASAATVAAAADDPDVLKNEGVEELPFVPASQRKQAAESIDDTIVVVGQPKRKKRKRVAEKATDASDAVAGQGSSVKEEEVEAFDYASASNILDDGSDHERADVRSAKKRQKHVKGSNASFYGNFGAPPKAHSQLKSGNQSRTFR
ncbi:hypothetical protein LXA43DRAFT_1096686 [Ganoderma leucocontextum]|nr:hypothetical protein LXA43DRAFT_1096686 [Ganoderma leucocontextum]